MPHFFFQQEQDRLTAGTALSCVAQKRFFFRYCRFFCKNAGKRLSPFCSFAEGAINMTLFFQNKNSLPLIGTPFAIFRANQHSIEQSIFATA
jgi:hypothetical protein